MLFAFRKRRWGLLLIFYIIIYHGKELISSARVRVCENFKKKCQKSPETAFAGDLTLCLEMKNLQKRQGAARSIRSTFLTK